MPPRSGRARAPPGPERKESELAKSFGPEEAHRLDFSSELCSSQGTYLGPGADRGAGAELVGVAAQPPRMHFHGPARRGAPLTILPVATTSASCGFV